MRLKRRAKPWRGLFAGAVGGVAVSFLMGSVHALAQKARPGAAVWLGAHVVAVPALGLSEPITKSPMTQEAGEFGAHIVYGTVSEGLRRATRTYVLR
jgi:uncharacterized membrane protein YagU involved in acid resistance